MEDMGFKFTPVIGRHLLCHLIISMFRSMAGTSGSHSYSPNSPNEPVYITHYFVASIVKSMKIKCHRNYKCRPFGRSTNFIASKFLALQYLVQV